MADDPKKNEDESNEDEKNAIEPIREVAATYVDSFFVSVTPTITRISFAEITNEGESMWRLAVVLPTVDAKELSRIIAELAAKNDEAEAKAASGDKK